MKSDNSHLPDYKDRNSKNYNEDGNPSSNAAGAGEEGEENYTQRTNLFRHSNEEERGVNHNEQQQQQQHEGVAGTSNSLGYNNNNTNLVVGEEEAATTISALDQSDTASMLSGYSASSSRRIDDAQQEPRSSYFLRLFRFYQKYNPLKIPRVEEFLDAYKGEEEELFKILTDKYGPEPPAPQNPNAVVMPASASAYQQQQQQQQQGAMAPPSSSTAAFHQGGTRPVCDNHNLTTSTAMKGAQHSVSYSPAGDQQQQHHPGVHFAEHLGDHSTPTIPTTATMHNTQGTTTTTTTSSLVAARDGPPPPQHPEGANDNPAPAVLSGKSQRHSNTATSVPGFTSATTSTPSSFVAPPQIDTAVPHQPGGRIEDENNSRAQYTLPTTSSPSNGKMTMYREGVILSTHIDRPIVRRSIPSLVPTEDGLTDVPSPFWPGSRLIGDTDLCHLLLRKETENVELQKCYIGYTDGHPAEAWNGMTYITECPVRFAPSNSPSPTPGPQLGTGNNNLNTRTPTTSASSCSNEATGVTNAVGGGAQNAAALLPQTQHDSSHNVPPSSTPATKFADVNLAATVNTGIATPVATGEEATGTCDSGEVETSSKPKVKIETTARGSQHISSASGERNDSVLQDDSQQQQEQQQQQQQRFLGHVWSGRLANNKSLVHQGLNFSRCIMHCTTDCQMHSSGFIHERWRLVIYQCEVLGEALYRVMWDPHIVGTGSGTTSSGNNATSGGVVIEHQQQQQQQPTLSTSGGTPGPTGAVGVAAGGEKGGPSSIGNFKDMTGSNPQQPAAQTSGLHPFPGALQPNEPGGGSINNRGEEQRSSTTHAFLAGSQQQQHRSTESNDSNSSNPKQQQQQQRDQTSHSRSFFSSWRAKHQSSDSQQKQQPPPPPPAHNTTTTTSTGSSSLARLSQPQQTQMMFDPSKKKNDAPPATATASAAVAGGNQMYMAPLSSLPASQQQQRQPSTTTAMPPGGPQSPSVVTMSGQPQQPHAIGWVEVLSSMLQGMEQRIQYRLDRLDTRLAHLEDMMNVKKN